MNKKEVYRKLNTVKEVAVVSGGLVFLVSIFASAAIGEVSKWHETPKAENMLKQLGLLDKNVSIDGSFGFSEDGKEVKASLSLSQKDGTSRSLTIIFPRDNVSGIIAGKNIAIKIEPENIIERKSLSFSPFSLPHSEVKDLKTSDKIKLEGTVNVIFPTKKSLTDFKNSE